MNKVRWIVSLSNGETLYEEKGNFKTIKGELSPWQRLLSYMSEQKADITSISLINEQGRRYNLAGAGKSPKFHAFSLAEKPIGLNFFRKFGGNVVDNQVVTESADHFAVIEAIYPDYRLQLWVDDSNGNCWTMLTK